MKKSLILIMGAATLAMPMHAQEESNASHYSILAHIAAAFGEKLKDS